MDVQKEISLRNAISYCIENNDVNTATNRIMEFIRDEKEAITVAHSSLQLPSKEITSLELDSHLKKWGKSHTKKTNSTYALGFRHCYHFISDYVKGLR